MNPDKLTEHIIRSLEDELLNAIKASDIPALDRLLHDDLLFIAPNGSLVTKALDLASHRAGTMIVDELSSTIEQIRLIDDTAIVIVVYNTRGRMMGIPITGKFRYIRIWKRFSGQAKVIGGSCAQVMT
jgi:hypothetical protein